MEVDDPETGIIVKLPGRVEADPVTGQLTVDLRREPAAAVLELAPALKAGPGPLCARRPTCGAHTTTSSLTPWSAPQSGPPLDALRAPSDQPGANGAGCPAAALTARPQARSRHRQRRSPAPTAPSSCASPEPTAPRSSRALEAKLPQGLLGKLAGIPYCSDGGLAAAAGKSGKQSRRAPSCPAAPRSAPSTSAPAPAATRSTSSGKAYLAGPYKGAPLSASRSITPAVAGPFDLGTVVVRNALHVDPETAQITRGLRPDPDDPPGHPARHPLDRRRSSTSRASPSTRPAATRWRSVGDHARPRPSTPHVSSPLPGRRLRTPRLQAEARPEAHRARPTAAPTRRCGRP